MNKIKNIGRFLISMRLLWINAIASLLMLLYLLFTFDLSLEILLNFILMLSVYMIAELTSLYSNATKNKKNLKKAIANKAYLEFNFPKSFEHDYTLEDYTAVSQHLQQDLKALMETQKDQERELFLFNTMLTHQMKVPLAVLDLMVQTKEVDPDSLEEEVAKINHDLDLMLQFSRLNSPTTDYKFIKINLTQLINEIIKKYRRFFIKKDLTVDLAELSINVISDQKWLNFVLEQIIFNAVKYTKTGGLKIYEDGQQLIIEDSGIGIDPKDLARVFSLGFTGTNGRIDQKASGLGLFMVKKVLDSLGHQITIESQPNVGTKVIIDFAQKSFQ